jgi:hypothetical protein
MLCLFMLMTMNIFIYQLTIPFSHTSGATSTSSTYFVLLIVYISIFIIFMMSHFSQHLSQLFFREIIIMKIIIERNVDEYSNDFVFISATVELKILDLLFIFISHLLVCLVLVPRTCNIFFRMNIIRIIRSFVTLVVMMININKIPSCV